MAFASVVFGLTWIGASHVHKSNEYSISHFAIDTKISLAQCDCWTLRLLLHFTDDANIALFWLVDMLGHHEEQVYRRCELPTPIFHLPIKTTTLAHESVLSSLPY